MAQGQTEPSRRPWWLSTLIILVLISALGFAAFLLYRRYEPDRLTSRARGFLQNSDYRNAVLTVRRALEINPRNQAASRLMAEITEQLQIPESLDWRRRVAELNPGSAPDALAWAAAAVRAGKTTAAEQALASIPESARQTASYQSQAGTVALSAGKWKEAEKYYAEALRLDPSDELHQYNLATLQLQSPDADRRKTAGETLERLARSGGVQVFAERSLITRAIGEANWEAALAHSEKLLTNPAAQFSDRLNHLDLLRRAQRPELNAALQDTQSAATTDPARAALVLNWMRLNGLSSDAVKWAAPLPANLLADLRCAPAYGECLVEAKDWVTLRKVVAQGPWAAHEELRLAFLARALREEGDAEGSRAQWNQAIGIAAKNRETTGRLAYLAMRWGWKDEARQTLWAAVDTPSPQWALQALNGLCRSEGDTNGMLRVATKLSELNPKDDGARNNVAMLSLLLGRDVEGALAAARALYEKAPTNPTFASTYAFALHVRGDSAQGVAVLRKLTSEQLHEPSLATYYGLLLASTGAVAEARPFLELSKKAPLLPEEQALVSGFLKE